MCASLQIACAVASKILVQDMYKCMWRRSNNGYGRYKIQKKHIHWTCFSIVFILLCYMGLSFITLFVPVR